MWCLSRGLSRPRHVTEHLCFISASVLLSIWHPTFTSLGITGGIKRDKTLCSLLKQCLTYNKSSISTFLKNKCGIFDESLKPSLGFPGGSDSKESACNVGDPGLIPGLGRSPGDGNGNPLQYSHLENSMDRGGWRGTVHRVRKSRTRLSS